MAGASANLVESPTVTLQVGELYVCWVRWHERAIFNN